MSRAPTAPSSAVVALIAALVTGGSGCARLVTLSPTEIAASNDTAWKIKGAPPLTTVGDVAVVADAPGASRASDAPSPVIPIAAASIPMRERPDVRQALGSPPDSLGIPTALYALDPILTAHQSEMRSEANARNQAAAGIIVLGVVFGAVSAWALSVGLKNSNTTNQSAQSSASQTVVYGSLGAVLSLGEIIAGTVLLFTSPNSAPLTSYYRETYVAPR